MVPVVGGSAVVPVVLVPVVLVPVVLVTVVVALPLALPLPASESPQAARREATSEVVRRQIIP